MTITQSELNEPVSKTAFQPISAGRKIKNSLGAIAMWGSFLIAVIPLVWLLSTVVGRGWQAVVNPDWWQKSLRAVLPDQIKGGAYHAIYGTLVQSLAAAVLAVPLGILVAVYLVEYGRGPLAKVATFMVDILSGVPSIVAALFIYAVWISTFGFEKSAFAVSLALVLLMLPVVVRNTEEMLRLVPQELREASYALGVPKWKTILRIVLPTALSGIVTGIMLALARVMGETAPVLLLDGYSQSINYNLFKDNMVSLPLLIYNQFTNDTPAGHLRIWGAALTLILIIMAFNLIAALISRFSSIKSK
jgi:phosphate transport system permease protein